MYFLFLQHAENGLQAQQVRLETGCVLVSLYKSLKRKITALIVYLSSINSSADPSEHFSGDYFAKETSPLNHLQPAWLI